MSADKLEPEQNKNGFRRVVRALRLERDLTAQLEALRAENERLKLAIRASIIDIQYTAVNTQQLASKVALGVIVKVLEQLLTPTAPTGESETK